MIEAADIARIAEDAARSKLGARNISRVLVEPTMDSQGDDAWRIVIVITPDALPRISGDVALDNLVELQQQLNKAGENRLAIIYYSTEEELVERGDSEC